MGCGMGGCYSCVVPRHARTHGSHFVRSCLDGPVFDAHRRRLGRAAGRTLTMRSLRSDRSAAAANPFIAASGCFGYGLEYARRGRSRVARRRRRQGPVPRRARGSCAAAHRRDAGRHAERDRPAGHRRAPLRRREAAGAAPARRDGHRQHLRIDARRVLRGRARAVGPRGRRRDRAQHLLPEHQGRRHPVRLQPDRHATTSSAPSARSRACRSFPKLTPNVTDVASFARASEEAGADAVSLVNTFLAMAIDVETRRPKLTNVLGGLSGPAIRPIAVRMVWECRQAVKLPISAWAASRRSRTRSNSSSPARRRCRSAPRTSSIRSSGQRSIGGLDAYLDAAQASRASPTSSARTRCRRRSTREPDSRRARRRHRRRGARAGRHAARRRRRLQDRQPAVHGRRARTSSARSSSAAIACFSI